MNFWRWTFVVAAADESVRESLCTLGNGYVATRGCAPEVTADGVHYPGTYAGGVYNRLRDTVGGVVVENESMVNLPNWLPFTLRADGGPWLGAPECHASADSYELDLRRGVLNRNFLMTDNAGRVTRVRQRRFVHMRRPHVCGLRTTVTPVNWSGVLTVRSGLDGGVRNNGVLRYRDLDDTHLERERADATEERLLYVARTRQSRIRVATATRTTVTPDPGDRRQRRRWVDETSVAEEVSMPVSAGKPLTVDKLVTIATSRDVGISEPAEAAQGQLTGLPAFDELLDEHAMAWSQRWRRYGFRLGDRAAPAIPIVRLHLFHLLQTISVHNADIDAGVPARGLHGEAYRGHVLWDELFVLPVLNLHDPALSRSMLQYRYRRLPTAIAAATATGRRGAMYPWQSGSDGREENQRVHLNPMSGRWLPDNTFRQRHVGLAVAANVWRYCEATADWAFLDEYGAEILLQVARFFADLAEFDAARGRYVIRGVMGPDEFHTGYPGRSPDGVDNNAYTNVMAAWLLTKAAQTLARLTPQRRRELMTLLRLGEDELAEWDHISRHMFVPFRTDGVMSQFEGYDELLEFDWNGYRERYGDITRLDRILEAEGDDINRYQASKQADVLMLFYLLSADELRGVLARCGYTLAPADIPRTVEFYRNRTTHGSTLSSVVHAWVLARGRRHDAFRYFVDALESDVRHVHGGTTGEGIHLAAMAATVDLLQRCFGGVETRDDTLFINPYWPVELSPLAFEVCFRGHRLWLTVSGTGARVECPISDRGAIRVGCRDRTIALAPGQVVELAPDLDPRLLVAAAPQDQSPGHHAPKSPVRVRQPVLRWTHRGG